MNREPKPDIAGYDIGDEVGRGGMGVVYSAVRRADGKACAVKVVRPDLAARSGYVKRLRAEAKRASAIRHPGVVAVHDAGANDDVTWIVMDLVDGSDLQRHLDEHGPLPARLAAKLIADVADAVSEVHREGLVHRDLKPANVLLRKADDGALRPLVSDFGLAVPAATVEHTLGSSLSLLTSGASDPSGSAWFSTASGTPLSQGGTVAYMAPEQWRNEECTERADIYALAGTLFAALTGSRPFPQSGLAELAYAVANDPAPSPSASGAPKEFDAVVAKGMAKDPADRFATAAEFAQAVRAAGRGERLPVKRRPRRALLVSAAVALLGLVAVLWWAPWTQQPNPGQARRVVCAQDLSLRDAPKGVPREQLLRGQEVAVDLSRVSGPWSHVSLPDGRQGWVLNQFLRANC